MIKNNHYQDSEYHYLKLKVDFYERSNRILHAYLGDRNNTMKMHAELLSRILNYPVSIVLYQDDQKILFDPRSICRECCDNPSA